MMTTKRRTHWMVRGLGISLLGGLGLSAMPLFAGGPYPMPGPDPRCNKCPDGVCVPNRLTYGYYAPKWRRWPGAAPALGPEVVPTPPHKEPDAEEKPSSEEGQTTPDRDERSDATDRDRSRSTEPKADIPRSDSSRPTPS